MKKFHSLETSVLLKTNQCFIVVFSILLFSLITSLFIEHIQKVIPCRICNYQRIIYCSMAFLTMIGIFIRAKSLIVLLVIILGLFSISLACYHIGVQSGFFQDTCSVISAKSTEAFKMMLYKQSRSCATIDLVMGFPISILNLIISSFCVALSFLVIFSGKNLQKIVAKIKKLFNFCYELNN